MAFAALAHGGSPNVILVLTDDQGYGDLSCHGNPVLKTPSLDRLHDESLRFIDFHAAPMCTPTRGQIMTGVDALRNGAMNVSSGRALLRRGYPTMPQIFAASGYRTAIFGKWHLGDNHPFRPQDRGFQECLWFPSSHIGSVPDAWENDYFDDTYNHNGQKKKFSGYCTDVFFAQASAWIRERASKKEPFFAYIAPNAPHGPLFVPDKYREPYREMKPNVASFFGMIANIDERMGELDSLLRETGLRDNTILIFMTDNGGTAGVPVFNAGMRGAKVTLWEGGHRVPCFFRWPAGRLAEPGDIPGLAESQDILPTLIDLCGLHKTTDSRFDGISLAPTLRGQAPLPGERMLVVNYSRMPHKLNHFEANNPAVPRREGAAVLWKRWRLLEDRELYNLDDDPAQQRNAIAQHPDVAARMRAHLDAWWNGVRSRINEFESVTIGDDADNPTLLTACEWADVFLDQQGQVRRGERKNGFWHVDVARAGRYIFELRRWPRESGLRLSDPIPETRVTDGTLPAGPAFQVATARLKVGDTDQTQPVDPSADCARFHVSLPAGRTSLQTWFLDGAGTEIAGAYYVHVDRQSALARHPPHQPAAIIFDTDIMGDVDDVGAVAAIHALIKTGELKVLAMGVCSKHPSSPLCLDALNTYFGRPDIPIGFNRREGFLKGTRYADKIAEEFKHALPSADAAPDAISLYRRILSAQPDGSVVFVSVGQLSNVANLLESPADSDSPLAGIELVRQKIKLWVCMGGKFPEGREANFYHHADAAIRAVKAWPTPVVFSGWEIGVKVLTGGALANDPPSSPVRRAYELFNGISPHKSWDQTAVLYAARGTANLWSLERGRCVVKPDGSNSWSPMPDGPHARLLEEESPAAVAAVIEALMTEKQPR